MIVKFCSSLEKHDQHPWKDEPKKICPGFSGLPEGMADSPCPDTNPHAAHLWFSSSGDHLCPGGIKGNN